VGRRPLAAIVLKEGESATEDELQRHLENDFAKFWLPDAYEFVESIPMTATASSRSSSCASSSRATSRRRAEHLARRHSLKVIGAGFGRTGTMSLKVALETLGFGPCYHMIEVFEHPEHIGFWEAAWRGEPVDWDASSPTMRDRGLACLHVLRRALERNPDAKVLLSVRDPEKWYESTRNTIYELSKITAGSRLSRVVFAFVNLFAPGVFGIGRMGNEIIWEGTFDGRFEEKAHAIEVFERHNREVLRRVPEEQLLVYEVKQGWGPLCEFLGVEEPGRALPAPQRHGRDAAEDPGRQGAGRSRANRAGPSGPRRLRGAPPTRVAAT
jgi:hypothetical protein